MDSIPDALTNYYGVDWVLFLLILSHMWALGKRKRYGWLIGACAAITGAIIGVMADSIALAIMNVFFTGFHIRNYIKWSSDK